MTHFSVLVIGDNPDELMAPYDENLEVDEHVALTRKEASEKKKDELKKMKGYLKEDPDGKKYRIQNIKKRIAELESMPDEVYFKDRVQFYEKFNENGEPLTTSNPDAHWDYWGPEDILWTKGKKKQVSSAKAKDIDWERHKMEGRKEAEKQLKIIEEEMKKNRDVSLPWDRQTPSERLMNREAYIAEAERFHTYAVVTPDGEWHAPGQCGWFGMSSESEDDWKNWAKKFHDKFIKDLPPNTKLTFVDCHI